MKPFQPRTLEQQRKNYVKACKQRLSRELEALKDLYQAEHDRHRDLWFERTAIEEKLAKAQDRVADAADKEFGGWDVWRHDEALLKLVVKRMDDAVVGHRERIAEINVKIDKCLAKFNAEREALTNKYYTLIKTA
jgi:hypothetical protein